MFFKSVANSKNNSQKKIRPTIKKDPIHPADYNKYNLPFACENCSHFSAMNETCTLGLISEPHLKRNQEKSYFISGKVALCRFIEID